MTKFYISLVFFFRLLLKRYIFGFFFALVVAVLVIMGAYVFYDTWIIRNNNEGSCSIKLDPEDVHKPIPPSRSILGKYKHAVVVSNGRPCAKIGV